MDIIFTTNKKFWSRAFKYLTCEPFSYIALVFNFDGIKLIIDCSTDGGRLMPIDKFLSRNEPLAVICIQNNKDMETRLFKAASEIVGKKYDYPAYIYGIWRSILFKLFKIDAPFCNPYSAPDKYVCTEIFDPIKNQLREIGISFGSKDLAIETPYRLYLFLKDKCTKPL